MKKLLLLSIALLLALSSIGCGGIRQSSESIEATVDINHEVSQEGKVKVIIESNLPNQTNLLITLSNEATNYSAQDTTQLSNGRAETAWFSDLGEALVAGDYQIDVIMPIASTQPASVKRIIGERGKNLTGPLVADGMGGNVVEKTRNIQIDGAKE